MFDETVTYELGTWKTKKVLRARNTRNGRIESWRLYDTKQSRKSQTEILKERIFTRLEKKDLQVLRTKIPDDHTAQKVKKTGKTFRTYAHGNITIFQYIPGFSPIVLYTLREDLRSIDMTQTFWPYQNYIAEVKSDVLYKTGITLEEWVLLAKTTGKYNVIGGVTWKLFQMSRYGSDRFIAKRSIDLSKV